MKNKNAQTTQKDEYCVILLIWGIRKGTEIVFVYILSVFRTGRQDWEWEGSGSWTVCAGDDERVLSMDSGDGYTTMLFNA